jgi:hypothetical protein
MVSIFRQFGKKVGAGSVRLSECNTLNPPEAKICRTRKRPWFAKAKAASW